MDADQIRMTVIRVVCNHLNFEIGEVNDQSDIDLMGADSLDRAEMAMTLEDKFNFFIQDEMLLGWKTVGDMIRCISEKVSKCH